MFVHDLLFSYIWDVIMALPREHSSTRTTHSPNKVCNPSCWCNQTRRLHLMYINIAVSSNGYGCRIFLTMHHRKDVIDVMMPYNSPLQRWCSEAKTNWCQQIIRIIQMRWVVFCVYAQFGRLLPHTCDAAVHTKQIGLKNQNMRRHILRSLPYLRLKYYVTLNCRTTTLLLIQT